MKPSILIASAFLTFLSFFGLPAHGSETSAHLFPAHSIFNGVTPKGDSVNALEYRCEYNIYHYYIDTALRQLFLAVRREGDYTHKNETWLTCYDITGGSFLWTIDIHGRNNTFHYSATKIIVEYPDRRFVAFNKSDGRKAWGCDKQFIYFDPSTDIALTATGEGVDLAREKTICARDIDLSFGIYGVQHIDAGKILLSANGVYELDINNGRGREFPFNSGIRNYKIEKMTEGNYEDVAAFNESFPTTQTKDMVFMGVLFGVPGLVSYMAVTTPEDRNERVTKMKHDLTHLCSNALLENDNTYIATGKGVTCLGQEHILWQTPAEEGAGNAYLLPAGDKVLLVNNGYGYAGSLKVPFGRPYIAAYDKTTGQQVYLQRPEGDKPLRSVMMNNDALYICAGTTIYKYDVQS